ncbi:hypothetical protein Tco_0863777 [Tanacetum coccineum]
MILQMLLLFWVVIRSRRELSRKSVNFHTLITSVRNGADVVVPLESIRATSEQFANTAYDFFLGKRLALRMDRPSYARAIIELRADVELNNTIACLKNLSLDVAKNLKNLRQAARGVPVGSKVGFKRVKQVYRHVLKNTVNTSGKKKQNAVSRQGVSNSNPFDALNSIKNDDDLDKIDKLKRQIIDCKLMFVHDDGNLLVPTGNVDSESEVEVVKQNRDDNYDLYCWNNGRKQNRDDNYDLYDDDVYESNDMTDLLEAICDDLDITVPGKKKK